MKEKTPPPLKGVNRTISPRRKREILAERRMKEEKKKIEKLFEERDKILFHRYGITWDGNIFDGRVRVLTDPYFTEQRIHNLRYEKKSECDEGIPPVNII